MRNFDADITMKNSLFFMNSVSNTIPVQCFGGAISNGGSTAADMTNCTFVGNVAGGNEMGTGGALSTKNNTSDTVTNCLFWANWATFAGGEIFTCYDPNLTIAYCNIEGGWDGPKVYDYNDSSITDGGGNINADPVFGHIFDFSDITVAGGTTTTIKVTDANRFTVGDEIEYDNDNTPREITEVNTTTHTITFANDALSSSSVAGKIIFSWPSGTTWLYEILNIYPASNCVDAGDPYRSYTGQVDIDGQDRVNGDAVDIGADEQYTSR